MKSKKTKEIKLKKGAEFGLMGTLNRVFTDRKKKASRNACRGKLK
jgi:hypothetical protein